MQDNRLLIRTAEPFMKQLNDFVQSSDFLTILTDKNGIILRIFGNDKILKEASEMKMIPGASMNENDIGTNAMGTVAIEKIPVQLVADDHFVKAYHRWTCSCAPIFDSNENLIGTLDLTGNTDFVHTHTLGMVVAAANALSNTVGLFNYQNQLIKAKTNIENVFHSITAGIITSDLSGNILFFNRHLTELFAFDEHTILSKKIWELFEGWNQVLSCLQNNQSFMDEDVNVYANKNILQLNLSTYPVYNYYNELEEITFVFKDVKKVRKLANKIVGYKAIYTFDKIISMNKDFMETLELAKKISDSKSTVLITGESGTGKEIIAQSIHNYGNRSGECFVAVNCGAIPKTLIESELFGYVEGAFTGAKRGGAAGKFEIADGGTIFLDEVGEMPVDMQANLLRVIEESYITRVGSSQPIPVNVRIIAATNKDLRSEVDNGNFRKDLFYRLNVLPVHLPPLRSRIDDIPLLADHFMHYISKRLNKREIILPDDFMNIMIDYNWPGNIRELENLIEMIINTEKIPLFLGKKNPQLLDIPDPEACTLHTLKEIEKNHILHVLQKTQFNIMKSAKILDISRNTLYKKIAEYDIHVN
jgi:PAS domain S-box-containing protein